MPIREPRNRNPLRRWASVGRASVGRASVLSLRGMFRSPPMWSDKSFKIIGITKDSAGVALGNCIVDLFYTNNDVLASNVESDASGNFTFLVSPSQTCYIVAYKAGSPDVAGTSINTLVSV